MIKIAVSLPPEPGLPWTLMRQCGVDFAVCHGNLQTIPNAPEDVVAALGALGRIMHISRKEGLIVVRLGNQPPRAFDMELWRLLMEARTE